MMEAKGKIAGSATSEEVLANQKKYEKSCDMMEQ
jgi:hypothetical protein